MKEMCNHPVGSWRRWLELAGFWYGVLSCYLLVLGFLSLNPWVRPVSTRSVFSPDKIDHALAYGGLAVILYFCIERSRVRHIQGSARAWAAALAGASLIGILFEVAQSLFTTNRVGSVGDALANAIGAGVGYAAYRSVKCIHARIYA